MTTDVYRVWSRESSVPLTIFAPSADEAALAFREWVSIHMPAWTKEPAKLEEVSAEQLTDEPQLGNAVERAKATGVHDAVMMFTSHDAGWIAVPTFAAQIGAVAPVEPAVRCYEVRVEKEHIQGVEVIVFAYDQEHALQLYQQWHLTFYGACNHPHLLSTFSRWTLTGDQTVLREQMDMGCVGIAGWSPVRGWSIYPADHEMAGE